MGGARRGRAPDRALGFSDRVLRGLVDKGSPRSGSASERDPFAELMPAPARMRRPRAGRRCEAALHAAAAAPRRRAVPAARRDRLRQDARLHRAAARGRAAAGQGRHRARARDRADAADRRAVPREFGDVVAVLHSALSDGERYDAWRALREGTRRIAIGARSAIFAPVRDLGAIIVDEEHEASYKQSEAPRYHAREVAVVRAARPAPSACSAARRPRSRAGTTRSAASTGCCAAGARRGPAAAARRGHRPARASGAEEASPLPRRGPLILAEALIDALHERLRRGEQSILLLNRRGYATFVQCRACGHVWHCEQCNVSLTYHRGRKRLVCHYCLHEEAPPGAVHACRSEDISFRGVGTEQVEREVAELFPRARIARMDVDTTSAKWAHHDILERVGAARSTSCSARR
jgi:hypothetical protein